MRMLPLIIVVLLLLTFPALAQYEPQTPKGYALTAVPEVERISFIPPHPLVIAAEEASGLVLDGLFRVEPGMSRYFELDRSAGGEMPQLNEYALRSVKPQAQRGVEPASYSIGDSQVHIGVGTSVNDPGGFGGYVVASFLPDGAGGMEELDRFSLGGHSGGVYALDLLGDGVITLVCPFATGAGGGGGVEVRAVVPTGGLAFFGANELDSTLFSQTGYVNLIDYDGDGAWEIETLAPVLCSACGYFITDLWRFDATSWTFASGERAFPKYYEPQRAFYKKLNEHTQQLAASSSKYRNPGKASGDYAVQIDGQWYTLEPFISSDGEVDNTWVQALRAMVKGWR